MSLKLQDYESALKYGALVTGANLTSLKNYCTVAFPVSGTSAVNAIAATMPFACTLTGAYANYVGVAGGTTTITIADTAGTVGTIITGTTVGIMSGLQLPIANTAVAVGDTLTATCSNAGTSIVYLTFTVA